jgi:hypothetical protein
MYSLPVVERSEDISRRQGRKGEPVPVISNSEHPRFRHDVAQVSPVESVRELTTMARQCLGVSKGITQTHLDDCLVVDITVLVHRPSVNLEDLESRLLVRERHLDFAVEPAGAHQCGIKCVWPVCRHDKLCAPERVKAVHLVQQLSMMCVRA